MKRASLLSALAAAVLLCPGMARGEDRNVITRIEGGSDAQGVFLRIRGNKAPSFTHYRLERPARLVLDLGDAVLAGPPAELPLSLPALRSVRTLMYESHGVSFTRVVIETGEAVPYRIEAKGTDLLVYLAGESQGRALARRSALDAVAAARRAHQAEARLKEANARLAELTAQADRWRAQAEHFKTALDEARAAAEKARARSDEEARALAAAQQELTRRDAALAAARKELQNARASAEEAEVALASARRKAADAEARLSAARQEAEGKVARALREAQAQLERATHERDVAQARAEAARQRLDEAGGSLEAALARVRSLQDELASLRAEAARNAEAAREARAEAKALAEREAEARQRLTAELERLRRQGRLAGDASPSMPSGRRLAWQYESGDAAGGETSGVRVDNRPKVMSFVGFQQRPDVSRVYVRTNEPVRYTVTQQGDEVWLELENTRAATLNDLNHLDTRFFDSAVVLIDPEEIEGAGSSHIRIRIRLRQNVPYEASRSDNEIRIDFRRPGH